MSQNFNKYCYNFQKKIIDIFNEEEDIPFLLKYYLFKDIWKSVEQKKFLIDRDVRFNQVEQKDIFIPAVSSKNDQNEEKKQQ